jgi:DNA-binding transcriptional ArsR family regulator
MSARERSSPAPRDARGSHDPPGGRAEVRRRASNRHSWQDAPLGGTDEGQSRRIEGVFAALADPTRRQLLEALSRRPASTATMLAAHVPVSRQAVAKHLATLRESRLVTSHRAGKEVLFSVRPDELAATASWMTSLAATWQQRLQRLKEAAES